MSLRLRVAEDSEITTAYHWAGDAMRPLVTRLALHPSSALRLNVQVVHELAGAATKALEELSDPDAIYRTVGAFVDYVRGSAIA